MMGTIGWLIIACEAAFWVFVFSGLAARYILRLRKLGAILLLCTPLIDLFLLIATVIDLRNGATARFVHGLAAVYIGVTIVYGRRMIKRTDAWFAHRFASGPNPQPTPTFGREHARLERAGWYRHLLAWVIGVTLLLGMIVLTGNTEQTRPLAAMALIWTVILVIDFLISFSYTVWPKKPKTDRHRGVQ